MISPLISEQLRVIIEDLRKLRDEVHGANLAQAAINQKYDDYISSLHRVMMEHVDQHKVISRRIWEIVCGVVLSLVTAIIGLVIRFVGG